MRGQLRNQGLALDEKGKEGLFLDGEVARDVTPEMR
jgi:hypothetical protein